MRRPDEQDILLNEFFKPYRKNIPDNGFTQNIMKNLTQTEPWINLKDILISLIILIGIICTIPYLTIIRSLYTSINLYNLLFIIFSLTGIIITIITITDPESDLI